MVHDLTYKHVLNAFLQRITDEFSSIHGCNHLFSVINGLDNVLQGGVFHLFHLQAEMIGRVAKVLDIGAVIGKPALVKGKVTQFRERLMDAEAMQDELFTTDRTEHVSTGARDACNLFHCIQGAFLYVVEIGFLDAGDLFQIIEAHPFDDVFLEHESVVVVLYQIQYGGYIHHGFIGGVVRRRIIVRFY